MKPIRNAPLLLDDSSDMLCLLYRGSDELDDALGERSGEGRRDVSNRRQRSLIVTRRGRSLDD